MKTVTLGLLQAAMSDDVQVTTATYVALAERAAKDGAQIICLPEMYRSRYFCNEEAYEPFSLAEPLLGPSVQAFQEIALTFGVVVIVPIFECRAPGLYHNSAVVIDADGRVLGAYRKMHIPDDPEYYEKFYFTPGDLGFKTFDTRFGKIGVLICWDQWFPEAARLTALEGAELIVYPTAIGWHRDQTPETNRVQQEAWETIQRSHAIANGVFVASVNRIGTEGAQTFWGDSFVCDPSGAFIARANSKDETVLLATCDLSRIASTRQHWPFLRDRRIDAYQGITERFSKKDEF